MSTRLTPSDLSEILTATLPSPVFVKGDASGGPRPGTEPSPSNADSVSAAHNAPRPVRLLLPTRYMNLELPVPEREAGSRTSSYCSACQVEHGIRPAAVAIAQYSKTINSVARGYATSINQRDNMVESKTCSRTLR
jgi:hypothetical protein